MASPFPTFFGGGSDDEHETEPYVHVMVDWIETPNQHVFKADLPGLRKEDVKVELKDDRFLQISGDRKRDIERIGDKWHDDERSSGEFLRRFKLPGNADVDEVKASMENGVLIVTVPKVDAEKANIKSIEISGWN